MQQASTPSKGNPLEPCHRTDALNLLETFFLLGASQVVVHITERDFVIAPCVRKDEVFHNSRPVVVLKRKVIAVDEMHCQDGRGGGTRWLCDSNLGLHWLAGEDREDGDDLERVVRGNAKSGSMRRWARHASLSPTFAELGRVRDSAQSSWGRHPSVSSPALRSGNQPT